MTPAVTVIVPTCGVRERERSLGEAVESVIAQHDVRAIPLVVVNGSLCTPAVQHWLARDGRIRVHRMEEAGLPAALHAGRALVDTPFFATLDDDDLLLPHAMSTRLRTLNDAGDCEVVITNGYVQRDGVDDLNITTGADVSGDPLRALLSRNWLLPGSWLARTDRVSTRLFDGMPRFLECTFLAVRFATEYRMRWLGEPTVVHRLGSPDALSLSRAYVLGQAEALRQILRLPLPGDVRTALQGRIADAFHSASDHDAQHGRLRDAWRWHLASLRARGGLRYLPFTWRLLQAAGRERG